MTEYRIYPLITGMTIRPRAAVSFGINKEDPIECPVLAWYVTDGDIKILIDTGGEPANGTNHAPYYQEKDMFVDRQLGRLGVSCDDIDIVILTHLHWDHADNINLFRNACLYVQKDELMYAAAPLDIHKGLYNKAVVFSRDYMILDGDDDIVDGISVIKTPGHTPGGQCVLVNTSNGKYIIAGDTVNNLDNLSNAPQRINGLHTGVRDFYKSYKKITQTGAYVLAGHDMRMLEHSVYPQ